MAPIPAALVVGILVVLGKWSIGKSPSIDNAVGVAGIAIVLAILDEVNQPLSRAFGALVLVSALAAPVEKGSKTPRFIAITNAAGLTKEKK